MKYTMKSNLKDIETEIPKYKKKTQSNKSKSYDKSTHKHTYKKCLFRESKLNKLYEGSYCPECGKIGNMIRPTEKIEGKRCYRMLTEEEILSRKQYNKLEIIEIDSIFDKYVSIVK